MNCDEVLAFIEDYHYGELGGDRAAAVESHLRACESCTRALGQLEAEDGLYRSYAEQVEQGLEVGPASWERVSEAITRANRRHGRLSRFLAHLIPGPTLVRQTFFAAALVLISVAGTVITLHYYRSDGTVTRPQSQAAVESGTREKSLAHAMQQIRRGEQDYIEAINILSAIVDREKRHLDPNMVAEFEKNLRIIDANIAATRKAYYAHPSDPDLAQYMMAAYSRKLDLLYELAS